MFCPKCNSDLIHNHKLDNLTVAPMTNKSRIIYPACSVCGYIIQISDVSSDIGKNQKVLLITGTAGAGKTAIGQLIESRSDYVFIDGDAIQKRVNHFARQDSSFIGDSQTETINAMLILLALGYNVVVGYIIDKETFERYKKELEKYKIIPVFRVLVPERSICLQRDIDRECWTAGEKWVDMWYDEMRSYLITDPQLCIDSSKESLEETFWNKDLEHLVQMRKIRNDLAHTEGAFLEEFCTQYDIDWIRAFRERILNGSDPLTLLRKSNVRTQMSGQINNRLRQGGQLQPKNQEPKQYTYSQYSRDNQSNGKDNTPLWLGILIAGFAILAVVIVVIIIIVIVHIDSVVGE